MSNHNFVCFDCRLVIRENPYNRNIVSCPQCQKECVNIGYKIPVPSKNKKKEWARLEEQIIKENRLIAEKQTISKMRRKHEIEKEIIKLENRPKSEGMNSLLKRLKKEKLT